MSYGVSERASERTSERIGVKRSVRRKRMSELCEGTSEWRPGILRVDFIAILPTVLRLNSVIDYVKSRSAVDEKM